MSKKKKITSKTQKLVKIYLNKVDVKTILDEINKKEEEQESKDQS